MIMSSETEAEENVEQFEESIGVNGTKGEETVRGTSKPSFWKGILVSRRLSR